MAESSREKTMEALVAAMIRLLDRRGAGDVTVRDIAAEAGVNHGLVHHYFGSKEALLREAVRRASERINREHPPGVRASWSFRRFREDPSLPRILARVCLDGPHDLLDLAAPAPEVVAERFAIIRKRLEERGLGLAAQVADVPVGNAFVVSAVLGWFVFRPLFGRVFPFPPDADDQIERALGLLDAFFAEDPPPAGALAGPASGAAE